MEEKMVVEASEEVAVEESEEVVAKEQEMKAEAVAENKPVEVAKVSKLSRVKGFLKNVGRAFGRAKTTCLLSIFVGVGLLAATPFIGAIASPFIATAATIGLTGALQGSAKFYEEVRSK